MSRSPFTAFAAIILAAAALPAFAQDAPVVRIENGWQTNQALNVEKGVIESTPAGPGWLSAQWELLPSKAALKEGKGGLRRRTIRNVWTKQYLSLAAVSGNLIPGMNPDEVYGDWLLDPVAGYPGYFRIQSLIDGYYLHVEHGKLEFGTIQPNWQSAWWKIPGYVPVDYTAPVAAERARLQEQYRVDDIARVEADKRRANNAQAQARYQAQLQAEEEARQNAADAAQYRSSNGGGFGVLLGNGGSTEGTPQTTTRVPPPPSTPANTYRAAIDFCHSDLSNTGTANMLIVEFLGLDGLAGTQVVPGSGNCSPFGAPVSSDLQVEFKTYFDVRAVRISIVGDDAFFIDQVQLFKDGTRIAWDGRTNGGGWCLSTDPNDYRDWAAATSSCAAKYTFNTASN